MGLLRSGVQQMAQQATGAGGAVGSLARGLLTMGAGGPIALAVVGGIGAVALAWKFFTAEASRSREAWDKTLQAMAKTGPIGAARAEIIRLKDEMEGIRGKGWFGRTFGDVAGFWAGKGTRGEREAEAESARTKRQAELVAKVKEEAAEREKALAAQRESLRLISAQVRTMEVGSAQARAGAQHPGLAPIHRGALAPQIATAAEPLPLILAGAREREPGFFGGAAPEVPKAAGQFREAAGVAIAAFGAMATAAVSGSGQMATAFVGGLASILQAIPALTQGLGGLGGPIIGAVAGILGSLFGGGRKPMPVRVTNPEDLRQPPSITEIIVSPSGEELSRTRYEIDRRQRLGLTDRMGG
jgi:hypothetical protein